MTDQLVLVCMIQPNRFNPNVMQDEEFQALKKDMQVHGPVGIDPVLVSPFNAFYLSETKSRDDYVIIDGEHRWKAANAEIEEALGQ